MISRRRILRDAYRATLGACVFRNAWPEDNRSPADSSARGLLRQAETALQKRPGDAVGTFAFDSGGTRLAIGFESGTVLLFPAVGTATPIAIAAHAMRADRIQFGPAGDHFFTNSHFDDETRIWDAATGNRLHTIPQSRGPVVPTDLPGTSLVARSSALHLYDHLTRRLSPPAVPGLSDAQSLSYLPRGRVVAVGRYSGTLDTWRLDGNDVRAEIWRSGTAQAFPVGSEIRRIWFSAEGTRLWLVSFRAVEEWSVEPLARQRALALSFNAYNLSAVDDGRSLLALVGTSERNGMGRQNLEIVSLREGSTASVFRDIGYVEAMTFLPGTRTLVLASQGRLRRVDLG